MVFFFLFLFKVAIKALSSVAEFSGWRQQKAGCSLQPQGVVPWRWGQSSYLIIVASGQSAAQPGRMVSKAGKANRSKQLGKQKIQHSKASFDLLLTRMQSCLYQKSPWDSASLAVFSEFLVSTFF